MVRTRNAVKRQKVATVQSALFSPDVVFLLAGLLDARDLCQVSMTCQTLGGRQTEYNSLSLVEEASRRMFGCASVWERSCLMKYDGEGWIELYHHLLMLRSKLTFDQLVGANIQYGEDQSTVQRVSSGVCSALCSNHVMRSGRHFAVFTTTGYGNIGVVRPVKINKSDFDDGDLDGFSPELRRFWEYLIDKQTERLSDSNVHCCSVSAAGYTNWYGWTSAINPTRRIDGFQRNAPMGLLLDLDEGSLSFYQDGRRLTTLKDGLSGAYCWYASPWINAPWINESITIRRGLAPDE